MKVESSNLVDLWIFGDFMQTLQDLKKSEKSCEKCWRHHAATPNHAIHEILHESAIIKQA